MALVLATCVARDNKRARRLANLEVMRHTLDALEYVALVTSTFDDTDAVWDDFIDDKTMRVRHSLRLAKEAAALELERSQLGRLLEEQYLASRMLEELVKPPPKDVWDLKVEQLHAAERMHFQPWTMQECRAEMDEALKVMNAFMWSQNKVSTGMSFLGWHEERRLDTVRGHFQFEFTKTFKGYDIMDYVNVGWDTYTDPKTFKEVILANRLQCSYEVLQQLGPNTVISRSAQRFPPHPVDVYMIHACYLVFRIKTENALPGGEHGYSVRGGGSIGTKDVNYLNGWMFEALGCLLRSEHKATCRQLITSE